MSLSFSLSNREEMEKRSRGSSFMLDFIKCLKSSHGGENNDCKRTRLKLQWYSLVTTLVRAGILVHYVKGGPRFSRFPVFVPCSGLETAIMPACAFSEMWGIAEDLHGCNSEFKRASKLGPRWFN